MFDVEQDQSSQRQVSGAAISAAVLSIPCVITGPLALIPLSLSLYSVIQIKRSRMLSGTGIALFALVLSAVGVLGTKYYIAAYNRTYFLYSETQMNVLGHAILVYSAQNDDQRPTAEQWPDALVELGILDPLMLEAPLEDGDGVSYIYCPGSDWCQRTIMLYEDPKHWKKGVLVCFSDRRVEFLDHETFEQMLADQLAERGDAP